MENLAALLAQAPTTSASGEWQRHTDARNAAQALDGHTAYGRWGTKDGFPVLYLGRPRDSVVIEAYRHHVDPLIFDTEADREALLNALAPRALVTCQVSVSNLIDLRTPLGRAQAGLTLSDLQSATTDSEAYTRCQRVAQVAHQLRRHGIVTPAATKLGETLVLFMDVLPAEQHPQRSRDDELWQRLPEDPRRLTRRHLRVVDGPRGPPGVEPAAPRRSAHRCRRRRARP